MPSDEELLNTTWALVTTYISPAFLSISIMTPEPAETAWLVSSRKGKKGLEPVDISNVAVTCTDESSERFIAACMEVICPSSELS